MTLLLVGVLAVLTCYAFIVNRDPLSPGMVVTVAFFLVSLAAIYDGKIWRADISGTTVAIIATSIFIFILVSGTILSVKLRAIQRVDRKQHSSKQIELNSPGFRLSKRMTFIVTLFGILAAAIYVQAILQVAGPSVDWSDAMAQYRYKVAYDSANPENKIPTTIVYTYRLFTAFAYVYLYEIMNRLISKTQAFHRYLVYPPLVYIVTSLSQASRGQILVFVLSGVLMAWTIQQRKNKGTARINFGKFVKYLIAACLMMLTFVALNPVVGRTTEKSALDSLMTYVGGSVFGLDLYLQDGIGSAPVPVYGLWGAETFQGLYSSLGRYLGITDWQYSFQLEYRWINGVNIGNLYTALRYYLQDFGLIGMLLVITLLATFFSIFYGAIRTKHIITPFEIFLYSYLGVSLFYLPITEWMIRSYFNPPAWIFILLVWAVMKILPRYQNEEFPLETNRTLNRNASRFRRISFMH